jgi:HAD superfamily hydrolase (TIGR01509 family)
MLLRMSEIRYVFLDNGGVISDNSLLAPQWRRLIGGFFGPRLGGETETWAEADGPAFSDAARRSVARLEAWDPDTGDVVHERYLYQVDWLRSMCTLVGVEAPASDDDCAGLAREAWVWVHDQVRVPFPGVEDAVRKLAQDFTLFTASDGLSYELAADLGGLGIVGSFRRLYGPDLVNMPKQHPTYHERIFADARVDASSALVVDDWPEALRRARLAGARTVLVSSDPPPEGVADVVIRSLADLPTVLHAGLRTF